MRALRRFTVRALLPEPLAPLGELVMNLRWSWHPESRELFGAVDPDLWEATGHDPVRLLGEVGVERLTALSTERRFLRRLSDAADELEEYLSSGRWYQSLGPSMPSCIGYFSMEYGITEVLPQYSGGLGILAGDHLKAASDLGVPVIAVGLLYRAGYFVQSLSREGWQQERYPPIDPHGLPLSLLPLSVEVELPEGRRLAAQVWKAQVGRVPLLLLDSDVEGNTAGERGVTDRLYGGGTDHRLLQELLLGVGGVRALRAYAELTGTAEPEVFHANEGHAGFLGVERMRRLVGEQGLDSDAALAAVRSGTIFTTHTPVPAGIDRFPVELVRRHVDHIPGLPAERVLALGREPDPGVFNMADMGLRLAQRANGVSRLHGQVSREMFADLWPGFDITEVPISSVTNGVHAPTWMSPELSALVEPALEVTPDGIAGGFEAFARVPDAALWATRRTLRTRLVEEVRARLRASWLSRKAGEGELGWIAGAFDPDVLTIGFARRVPSYKRLTLMLRDPERLTALLLHPERPIQMVIAGKAHPADDGGKELVQQIVRFADREEVRHRIAFLPDYDIAMARGLYAGCDVWLNNPLRPLEACGTSGMKAALNGCLNLSVRDGWWDEMYDGENGWAIPTADGVEDPDRRDELEAAAIYGLLEQAVVPRFYTVNQVGGVPLGWVAMVRHTLESLGPRVLASRMMRDYVQGLYGPAAGSARAMAADGFAGARELAAFRAKVTAAWPRVAVRHAESAGTGDAPELGSALSVRAVVDLGGLEPGEVCVQVVFGRVTSSDEITGFAVRDLAPSGRLDGYYRFEGSVTLERPGPFGYTVRVLPAHPLMSSPAEFGLVANA
jgi:starch phosphorylase